jgi:hypothetical protein
MNNGCSLSTGRVANRRPVGRGHSTSGPGNCSTRTPSRGTITMVCTELARDTAWRATCTSGTTAPRRYVPSAVTTAFAPASPSRVAIAADP